MTPIKKKGGRHVHQPVRKRLLSGPAAQRHSSAAQPPRTDPPVAGCSAHSEGAPEPSRPPRGAVVPPSAAAQA